MPRIGRYWDGHGGIYAGIFGMPDADYHLIWGASNDRDVIWAHGLEWAQRFTADGLHDFTLPMCKQGALLYANLKASFPDRWFWLLEPYPPDHECSWVQTFGYGRQADARLTDACRACAVRVERCE